MKDSFPLLLLRCSRSIREVYRLVKRLARPECWASTARLAEMAGYAVRTVQLALAKLESMGIIHVLNDYSLRSRHRIVLLGPAPSVASGHVPVASPGRKDCAQVGALFAPTPGPIPITSVLTEREKRTDDDSSLVSRTVNARTQPVAPSSSSSLPVTPPGPIHDGPIQVEWQPGALRQATEQEVAALEQHAASTFNTVCARAKARALAAIWGLHWVEAALDQADRALERDGRIAWVYVIRCLNQFRLEGGPPESMAGFNVRVEAQLAFDRSPEGREMARQAREARDALQRAAGMREAS